MFFYLALWKVPRVAEFDIGVYHLP